MNRSSVMGHRVRVMMREGGVDGGLASHNACVIVGKSRVQSALNRPSRGSGSAV